MASVRTVVELSIEEVKKAVEDMARDSLGEEKATGSVRVILIRGKGGHPIEQVYARVEFQTVSRPKTMR